MNDRFGVHMDRLQNDTAYPGIGGRINASLDDEP
jgi:hypothetical protein